MSKVQSAFLRDQAPESEKCLVFGDLLTGSARNWYSQLSRSTRNSWKALSTSFMERYCGRGVPAGRQYYHAWKRTDETPLEYLYHLNVAGMCAKIPVKDGSSTARREHVKHYIHTLDDRDFAKQLTLLRLGDADELEETLMALQRARNQQRKASMGTNKYRLRTPAPAAPVAVRPPRAVKVFRMDRV